MESSTSKSNEPRVDLPPNDAHEVQARPTDMWSPTTDGAWSEAGEVMTLGRSLELCCDPLTMRTRTLNLSAQVELTSESFLGSFSVP